MPPPIKKGPARGGHRRDRLVGASAFFVGGAQMPEHPQEAKRFLLDALCQLEAIKGDYLCGCLAYELGRLTGKPPTDEERARWSWRP